MIKEKILSDIKQLKESITQLNNINETETKLDDLGIDLEDIDISLTKNSPKVEIKFINKSDNVDPGYFHEGDSGFDFRADLQKGESVVIEPGKRKLINTGLYFEVPKGYELQVRPRSGLALKNGITVLNTPGTVDSNYRGEIKIILINLGDENFIVNKGDRIAQGVISPVLSTTWGKLNKVSTLNTTDREKGGFGSTGIK